MLTILSETILFMLSPSLFDSFLEYYTPLYPGAVMIALLKCGVPLYIVFISVNFIDWIHSNELNWVSFIISHFHNYYVHSSMSSGTLDHGWAVSMYSVQLYNDRKKTKKYRRFGIFMNETRNKTATPANTLNSFSEAVYKNQIVYISILICHFEKLN